MHRITLDPPLQVNTRHGRARLTAIDEQWAIVYLEHSPRAPLRVPLTDIHYWDTILTSVKSQICQQPAPINLADDKAMGQRPPEIRLGNLAKRRALESLRFGLVPDQLLSEMTIGYDELSRWATERFPSDGDSRAKVSEIVGGFGKGKSHTLSVIKSLAKIGGYVVASLEIDGQQVTLADPESLLRHLWTSVEAEALDPSAPAVDHHMKAIRAGYPAPHFGPQRKGVDRVHVNYETILALHRNNLLEKFDQQIEAILTCNNEVTATEVSKKIAKVYAKPAADFPLQIARIIGRTVADRPYDFVEALFGTALISNLAGYKGLVVTVDEFEIQSSQMSSKDAQRVEALIKTLRKFLNGETGHPYAPCSLFFASVGTEGHLGDSVIELLVEAGGGLRRVLDDLDQGDIMELGQRVHDLYCRVYGITAPFDRKVCDRLRSDAQQDSGRVRSFIKRMVGYMDDCYGPPRRF